MGADDEPDTALFDVDGERLKHAGMTLALEAQPEWSVRAHAAIVTLASTGREFTSEDVIRLVGLPRPTEGTNRNNAVGAAFSAAARRREIRRVGYRNASRNKSHARALAVWWVYETREDIGSGAGLEFKDSGPAPLHVVTPDQPDTRVVPPSRPSQHEKGQPP